MIRCSFCTYEFSEAEGEKACARCAFFGGCRMVKCPRCGYEMPQTPGLFKLLKKWGERQVGASR